MTKGRPKTLPRIWRYLCVAALVLLATAAAEGIHRLTGTRALAIVFLTPVLITAFLFGAPEGYLAALLAIAAYNLYFAPSFSSVAWIPFDWVNLVVFCSVAMLTGNLTGRVRDEARQAHVRAAATAALFEAAREFSASADETYIKRRLAHHLEVVARGGEFLANDAVPRRAVVRETNWANRFAATKPDGPIETIRTEGRMLRPMYADGELVGVAHWLDNAAAGDQQALLEILTELGAVAVGRARLAAAIADVEAVSQTEDLRNALLSSISHDLRTPLAAIVASASSLEQYGERFDAATRADLASTIHEEAVRLNDFVENLLNMTRLEAKVITPRKEPFGLREAVNQAVQRRPASQARRMSLSCAQDLVVLADPILFAQAFGNVIENAVRYTPPDCDVEIACERRGETIYVEVSDRGPGVSPAELPMLFVKFYRTRAAEKIGGTGLGLSITKGVIEGMGGGVAARNRAAPETGLIVTMTLPAGHDG